MILFFPYSIIENVQNIELFSNLGLAGAALVIIGFIVRYFVQATTKKDQFIIDQTKEFTKQTAAFNLTVKNHMNHSTEALDRLAKAIDHLATNNDKKNKK